MRKTGWAVLPRALKRGIRRVMIQMTMGVLPYNLTLATDLLERFRF